MDIEILEHHNVEQDTCHELCKSLLSIEVQNFIDNLDVKAPLVITFPSKLITIAHLMMLQSKFGIPITVDIIAQALKIKVDSSLVQFIRNKIRFVKKGIMTYFKKYTNESCKHFLLSPYRTTEGNLKNLLKVRPKEIKKKTTTDVDVTSEKGGGELHPSTPPFQLGDKVEVIADTSPGVHSQHSCGIDRAEIVEIGEQCSKVRKIGPLDRNCLTTVPNQLLSPLSKTGLQEVLSRTELREEKKKRVLVDVVTSDVVEDNKKVIGEKDVAINKYLDLFNQERKINEELRAQVNTVVEEKNNLKSKFLSEKREYQKELQLEYETQQQKTELKCKKKLEELEAVAARELADVERHYSISLQTLEARTQLQEYEYKASFQALLSKQNQQHEEALLAKTIAERSATAKRKEIEEVVKKLTLAQAALSRGDPNDPSLTKEGKALAAALEEVSQRHRVRAERQAEFHKKEAARFQKETENALLLCNLKDEYLKATKAEVKALKQKLKRRDKSLADLKDGTTFSKQSPDKLPQFLREFKEISAEREMEFATRSDRHLEVEKRKVETLRRELQEARAELHEAAGSRGVEVFDDLVKENKKFALEKHVDGLDVEMLPGEASSAEVPPGYLLNCLSCKGRLYCQDIIELGLRLMGLELSAQQAQSVLRAFVEFQYPDKVEGIDYRIPDVRRFNEWRNYLGPLAHYVALSTVVTAERTHVLSDATTKRGYSVLQTVMRCEVTDPDTKELLVLDVPLKFEVCASGKAVDEAKQIRDALRSELLNGLQGSLVLVATSCTDNAARATSRELEKLKKKELDNLLLRAADEIEIDMHNNGDKYAAVIEAYRKLTPEQRKDALTLQELGCNGHTLNLVVDSCWKHTEKMVMKLNVEKNFAANVIQRFVCQKFNLRGSRSGEHALFNRCSALYVDVDVPKFIISLTKQFPSTVDEDADPRLQEKNSIDSYVRQDQATYRRMPGKLGSRQSFEVEVAAVIIHNTPVYSKYFDKYRECESANNLATTTAAHIKDKFVQAALRSRTFVCAGFNETARWFTHSECITVPMLGTIWKAIDDFLADDDFFESDQECPEPPPLTKLGDDILDALTARFPESLVDSVRNKHALWWEKRHELIESDYQNAIDPEFWPMTFAHLRSAGPWMRKSVERNTDPDFYGREELEHAPVTTDVVESNFSVVDRLCKLPSSYAQSWLGLSHSSSMGLMQGKGDIYARCKKEVMREEDKGVSNFCDREARIALKVKCKRMTNFFSLDRSIRWLLIKDVRLKYKTFQETNKLQREAHDDAGLRRKEVKIAAEAKRRIKAALDYAHYAHVVPVRTSSQVQTLVNDKEMDLSSHLSAMRNQIHVRLYVYGVKKADLPLIGSDGGEAEQTRLKEALVNLITTESPLPMTPPPAPDPYLLRALHRTPTKLALRLDHDYIAQIASVITQYKALVENGTFSLPRNRTHRPLVDDDSGNESDDGDTRQPATVPVPPRYANVAKPGTRFDEDDTTWQVLSMEFSEEYDQLLCYYFDVELAKKKNITVKDMKLAIEKDPPQELEPLERSKLSEVCKWIKEHREREM